MCWSLERYWFAVIIVLHQYVACPCTPHYHAVVRIANGASVGCPTKHEPAAIRSGVFPGIFSGSPTWLKRPIVIGEDVFSLGLMVFIVDENTVVLRPECSFVCNTFRFLGFLHFHQDGHCLLSSKHLSISSFPAGDACIMCNVGSKRTEKIALVFINICEFFYCISYQLYVFLISENRCHNCSFRCKRIYACYA